MAEQQKTQNIYIRNNGTRTLYTAGMYLDKDILIDVNIPQGIGSSPNEIDGLIFDSYQALLGYMRANNLSSYTIQVLEGDNDLLET